MMFFGKILNGLTPEYIFDILPVSNDSCYNTRAQSKLKFTQFQCRTKSFNKTFFTFCIKEWIELDAKIRNIPRSSHPEVFYKKGVLRNFEKVPGKHLYQSFFFNKAY